MFSPVGPAAAQVMPSFPAPPQQMTPTDVPPNYPSTNLWHAAGSNQPGPGFAPPSPPNDNGYSAIQPQVPNAPGRTDGVYGDPGATRFPGDGGFRGPYDDVGPLPATSVTPVHPLDLDASVERTLTGEEPWTWQILPAGLLYQSYLAGTREPRFASEIVHDAKLGWLWDATIGARVGLLRYGTEDPVSLAGWERPEGWQLDVEGAAFPRLDLPQRDLQDCDYRAGMLITRREGLWETKFGYYHYCSHLGDMYIFDNPGVTRTDYERDSLIFGIAAYPLSSLRIYWEAGWAFHSEGVARPWDLQFGAEFCSTEPTGPGGTPFVAINGHLHQEDNFGGNLSLQTGWQWRGRTGHIFRLGMQYFNGMSDDTQFYNRFEQYVGFGVWYDY
jgi:hypothetical protein